jgi:mannose-6-phosphate isomerase-like protein (cupin superfamily)
MEEFRPMRRGFGTLIVIGLLVVLSDVAGTAQAPNAGIVRPISAVKFEQDEDIKCLTYALESGDPKTGPSTHILKVPTKCVVPWHHHSAEEQVVVIRGSVLTEMEGMSPSTLNSGGFAMMPSKTRHRFSCGSNAECLILVTFDRPYDIFWDKEKQ